MKLCDLVQAAKALDAKANRRRLSYPETAQQLHDVLKCRSPGVDKLEVMLKSKKPLFRDVFTAIDVLANLL